MSVAGTKHTYSIDTSALIDGLERHYPEASFPAVWEKFEELIAEGRLLASEEVWEEVKSRDEVAKRWFEPRKSTLLVPTTATVAIEVQTILVSHGRLVMNLKNRNRADPFVMAVARLHGAVVVTGEGSNGTENRPKIPFVCERLGTPCIRLLDVIKAEGWRF